MPEFESKKRMERAPDKRHAQLMMSPNQCWEAVERHDRSFDGRFLFGVVTTGVYCRPSCPSRRPLRENVRFYAAPEEAERDGLRPCLRCKPLEASAGEKITELCRYIEEHADEKLDLSALAARAGLSRFHLQRSFQAAVGLTPKQYVEACRMRRLKGELRTAPDVAAAVYGAGYGSSSRVYERAGEQLGMTPREYRRGAEGIGIRYAAAHTELGWMIVAATGRGVCFVQFGESEEALLDELRREFPAATIEPMGADHQPAFDGWIAALREHLAGSRPQLDLPLDIRATAFRMQVWNYLQSIPYGETRSYREVAAGIGRPAAVRAVASACAGNRIALAIPCHRVIRGTGELGGYRWGLDRKQRLLDRERASGPGTPRPAAARAPTQPPNAAGAPLGRDRRS